MTKAFKIMTVESKVKSPLLDKQPSVKYVDDFLKECQDPYNSKLYENSFSDPSKLNEGILQSHMKISLVIFQS